MLFIFMAYLCGVSEDGQIWDFSWWRHQIETFSSLLALCVGDSPVTGEFPTQRPVTRSFDVFFDLRLNKRLNKQSRLRWFETPSRSLWRHYNVESTFPKYPYAWSALDVLYHSAFSLLQLISPCLSFLILQIIQRYHRNAKSLALV